MTKIESNDDGVSVEENNFYETMIKFHSEIDKCISNSEDELINKFIEFYFGSNDLHDFEQSLIEYDPMQCIPDGSSPIAGNVFHEIENLSNRDSNSSGLSPVEPDNLDGYVMFYSDPKELEQINNLIGQIKLCTKHYINEVYIAFIFVIGKMEELKVEFPVIRVRYEFEGLKEIPYFLDCTGRCYENWEGFLNENLFPSCDYCYPKNGFYTCGEDGNTLLEFGKSPDSNFFRKFSKVGDIASTVAGVGCFGVVLLSLAIPVAVPVMVGATATSVMSGIWTSSRATFQLIDKKKHQQKLTDKDARGCWLELAAGLFGVAGVGVFSYSQYLARNGRIIGKAAIYVVNGVEIGSTGLSAVNVINHAYNMYEDRKISYNEAAGLAMSLLFFCNTAVKFKSAKSMLIESQNEVLSGIEAELSRRQKKAFKKILKGTTSSNVMEGNALAIKTVMNLEDPQTYFREIARTAKVANKTKATLSLSNDASGRLNINQKVTAGPEVINSMTKNSKYKVFNSSKKTYESNKYSNRMFKRDMYFVSKKENLTFRKYSFDVQKKINMKTNLAIKMKGNQLFSSFKPVHIKKMNGIFKRIETDKNLEEIKPRIKEENCINLFTFVRIVLNIYGKVSSGESKKIYNDVMKFYEEHLKEIFERVLTTIIKVYYKIISELFGEKNLILETKSETIFRNISQGFHSTPWEYFETYFKNIFKFLPDRRDVIEIPQKVGWLFLLPSKSNVHSVIISPIIITAKIEKITFVAFKKQDIS